MFIGMIKFTLAFWISFFILSVPLGQETLFGIVYRETGPFTQQLYKNFGNKMHKMWLGTKDLGGQLFMNSSPQIDGIEMSSSAPVRKQKIIAPLPELNKRQPPPEVEQSDSYTQGDRERLQELLEN